MGAETLYIKDEDGNYKPYGAVWNDQTIPYGLWLIMPNSNGISYRNIITKISDIPNKIDMKSYIRSIMLKDIIADTLLKINDDSKLYSISDIALKIANNIYKKYSLNKLSETFNLRE